MDLLVGDRVQVVEDEDDASGELAELVDQQRHDDLLEARAGANAAPPRRGRRPPARPSRSASMTQVQKRTGSSSLGSSDSHANGWSAAARRHCCSRVVLPEPAGAESMVSRVCSAPATSATSAPRGTSPSRRGGISSFVAAMTLIPRSARRRPSTARRSRTTRRREARKATTAAISSARAARPSGTGASTCSRTAGPPSTTVHRRLGDAGETALTRMPVARVVGGHRPHEPDHARLAGRVGLQAARDPVAPRPASRRRRSRRRRTPAARARRAWR